MQPQRGCVERVEILHPFGTKGRNDASICSGTTPWGLHFYLIRVPGLLILATLGWRTKSLRDFNAEKDMRRLQRFGHVPCSIFKTSELFQESESDFTNGSVTLLGDNQFGFASHPGPGVVIFFVDLRPN